MTLPLDTPVIYSWDHKFSILTVVKRTQETSPKGRIVNRYHTIMFDFKNNPHFIENMSDSSNLFYTKCIGSTDLLSYGVYYNDSKAVIFKSKP